VCMKIYRISQNQNNGYDTYDSSVVIAPDEETARNMNPSTGAQLDWSKMQYSGWCYKPDQVYVELIGTAVKGMRCDVIVASFNSG
jgi:hypothetical protein